MYNDKILVFLSRPNPFLDVHQYFISKLQEQFDKYNIQTVTLQADNYDLTDSINYLKGMIKQCYGIAIIGFKQIFIETGSKKKGGRENPTFYYPNEIDISGQALTSPFYCQVFITYFKQQFVLLYFDSMNKSNNPFCSDVKETLSRIHI